MSSPVLEGNEAMVAPGRTLWQFSKKIPVIGGVAGTIYQALKRLMVWPSQSWWEARYAGGDTSGPGSHGKLAEFKAKILNRFISDRQIASVIEFGCGDGNQLSLLNCPKYTGLDVSKTAIALCRQRFKGDRSKKFGLYSPRNIFRYWGLGKADATLSLDVIFHLLEDEVFERYMRDLFRSAIRFVVIYSSNKEEKSEAPHVRHRKFTDWVDRNCPEWALAERIANEHPYTGDLKSGSFCDFYIYERRSQQRSER